MWRGGEADWTLNEGGRCCPGRLPRGPGVELFTLHWEVAAGRRAGSAGLRGGTGQELGGAGCPTCPPRVQGLEVHSGRWPHATHRTDRHPRPLLPLGQHSLRVCCVRRGTGTEGHGPRLPGFPAHRAVGRGTQSRKSRGRRSPSAAGQTTAFPDPVAWGRRGGRSRTARPWTPQSTES